MTPSTTASCRGNLVAYGGRSYRTPNLDALAEGGLAELVGAELPDGVVVDGRSFAAQLRGKEGRPREWVFTEWSGQAWVRDKRWKLYRSGQLYDMTHDAEEKHPLPENEALDVRARLGEVMKSLKP